GSGSLRVLDATYFCARFRTSVNGFGWGWFGQKAAKSSNVRRPNSNALAAAIPSAATPIITSSPYLTSHPPKPNTPRVSSSGRPGACMPPSSVTCVNVTILPIGVPPRVSRPPAGAQRESAFPGSHPLHEWVSAQSTVSENGEEQLG